MASYPINDFIQASGGDWAGDLDDKMRSFAVDNYKILYAALLILVLYIVYMLWFKPEGFNPGQTLRVQQRDDNGGTNAVQNQGVGIVASEQALLGPAPGSVSYKLLHDPGFGCANRVNSPDNAWTWLNQVVRQPDPQVQSENAVGSRGDLHNVPIDDSNLTKVMVGL